MTVSPCIHRVNLFSLRFWMYCRDDLRKLKRITPLSDYIREVTELNRDFLMGEAVPLAFAKGAG